MAEADSFCQRVAIMHLGTVAVIGTPADLKASLNREDATLADVFVSYAGDIPEATGRKPRHLVKCPRVGPDSSNDVHGDPLSKCTAWEEHPPRSGVICSRQSIASWRGVQYEHTKREPRCHQ
jgi:ABC-type multidrug transport system ATPase subunit